MQSGSSPRDSLPAESKAEQDHQRLTRSHETAGALGGLSRPNASRLEGHAGKPATPGVRAENIDVQRDPTEGDTLKAHVLVAEPLGSYDPLTARLGSELLKVATRPDMAIKVDEETQLQFQHERTIWLNLESARTIGM